MNSIKLAQYLSSPRLSRYLQGTQQDYYKAEQLYKANLRISKAFHPVMGILEVALRNQINHVLSHYFNDQEWIINQKIGFMSHSSLRYFNSRTGSWETNDSLKAEVKKAETRIKKNGSSATSGKVIAEMTFGFWTQLFDRTHYKNLAGRPIQIFANLPAGHGRKEVSDLLNKIRLFRNRIAHNEPICFKQAAIDFDETEQVHAFVFDILRWIDTDLENWTQDMDEIQTQIDNAKAI